MPSVRRAVERLVSLAGRRSVAVTIGAVAVGLLACWWIALESASAIAVSRHWFYVPIVLAAIRFGAVGGGLAGLAATLLGGPLVLTVDANPVSVWLMRGAFFLLVGLLVGALVGLVRDSLLAQLEASETARDLSERRAAVMQTVSHEFRTPLTIIRGGVETLTRQPGAIDERLLPVLEGIDRATRRLSEMVAIVLAAADAVEDEQAQESIFVPDLVDEVSGSLPDGRHRIMLHVAPGAERVVTVGSHLRLVVRELVRNALRFSPDDTPVEVRVWADEQRFTIRVRDHGEGIDPEHYRRAFEPFSQLDPSTTRRHGGLGMGLFATRRLVVALGGEITLAPAPTGGLDAVVSLPQRRTTDAAGEVRLPDTEHSSS